MSTSVVDPRTAKHSCAPSGLSEAAMPVRFRSLRYSLQRCNTCSPPYRQELDSTVFPVKCIGLRIARSCRGKARVVRWKCGRAQSKRAINSLRRISASPRSEDAVRLASRLGPILRSQRNKERPSTGPFPAPGPSSMICRAHSVREAANAVLGSLNRGATANEDSRRRRGDGRFHTLVFIRPPRSLRTDIALS